MVISIHWTLFSMFTQGTIKCSKETQRRLRGYGRMGDSFEKVIIRLLDESGEPLEKGAEDEI